MREKGFSKPVKELGLQVLEPSCQEERLLCGATWQSSDQRAVGGSDASRSGVAS